MKSCRRALGALMAAVMLMNVAGCASDNPFSSRVGEDGSIVVGSQDYYSNEIIAEIIAQSLEREGVDVARDMRIGQREAYLPDVESGAIDVMPEYTGNLVRYWDETAPLGTAEEVYEELRAAAPPGIGIGPQAEAADEDVYVMPEEKAAQQGIESLEDLAVPGKTRGRAWRLGGPYELSTRDYGPEGLRRVYGVDAEFSPLEDAGGPLTVKALRDGTVDMARMSSSSPAIEENHLRILSDPRHLLPPSHVVPLLSDRVDPQARAIIARVMSRLGRDDLVALNKASVAEQKSAATIAHEWLDGAIP